MKWRGMFTVVCENITAEFMDHNSAVFTYHGGKPAEEWWPTGKLPESQQISGDADAYLQESIAFLDAIEGRRKSSPTSQQGARSLEAGSRGLQIRGRRRQADQAEVGPPHTGATHMDKANILRQPSADILHDSFAEADLQAAGIVGQGEEDIAQHARGNPQGSRLGRLRHHVVLADHER